MCARSRGDGLAGAVTISTDVRPSYLDAHRPPRLRPAVYTSATRRSEISALPPAVTHTRTSES